MIISSRLDIFFTLILFFFNAFKTSSTCVDLSYTFHYVDSKQNIYLSNFSHITIVKEGGTSSIAYDGIVSSIWAETSNNGDVFFTSMHKLYHFSYSTGKVSTIAGKEEAGIY